MDIIGNLNLMLRHKEKKYQHKIGIVWLVANKMETPEHDSMVTLGH